MTAGQPTSRRGRPTAADSRRKLAHVLAVAREQFCAQGYRATTMKDVAEKADVSTRTLYNRYADKLSLFTACLEVGATAFPKLAPHSQGAPLDVLSTFAAAIVRTLTKHTSVRLGMLVFREGGEFPEVLKASEDNNQRFFVMPVRAYLHAHGFGETEQEAEELAKVFLAMALSEWQRRITYLHPMPTASEIERHAVLVTGLFLDGCAARRPRRQAATTRSAVAD